MVLICCPILAGEAVLNGLRGEHRRAAFTHQDLKIYVLFQQCLSFSIPFWATKGRPQPSPSQMLLTLLTNP